MTIHTLERVMWRIREDDPTTDTQLLTQLHIAIMKEIGSDRRTYINNKKALIKLGWIKPYKKNRFTLTNKDLD